MKIEFASLRVPVKFVRAINEDTALFEMHPAEILACKHQIAERMVILRQEGWPEHMLGEEQKGIDAIKKFRELEDTVDDWDLDPTST